MAVGLTSEGFVGRRQPEILEELITRLESDSELSGFNFRAGPIYVILATTSELIAQVWEAAEEVYASQYAGAQGVSLDHVAALTGTYRRAATRSTVTVSATLDAGVTLPAGSIVARAGDPDVQFRSIAAATNSAGTSADVDVLFESVETGPVAAPAGTLTVIPSPVAGWTAATNASDADLGAEIATDAELRAQRLVELAGAGASTVAAIRAAVARVEGVEEVRVYQNTTLATDADGRPAKSVQAVLWDGTSEAADDDEIAQAIWDNVAAGIQVYGPTDSGTATDEQSGEEHTVAFARATELRVYVDAELVLLPGTASGWQLEAREAIAARGQEYGVGAAAYASQLTCVLSDLDFVEAVTDLRVDIVSPPVTYAVATDPDEIVRIALADVTVAEAPAPV